MAKRIIVLPEELEGIQERLDDIRNLLIKQNHQLSDPIFNTEDVMKLLKVSRRTIQGWRDQLLLEHYAVGNKFFYKLSSIHKLLDNHVRKPEEVA